MLLGLVYGKCFWPIGRIFGRSFTWNTGWIGDSHLGRILGWLFTGTSTWVSTWISKSWSCAWLFFGSLNGMVLDMSLGNPHGSLIGSIWHINCCRTWLGAQKFLCRFNWVLYLLSSLLGTWHTCWHTEGTSTW